MFGQVEGDGEVALVAADTGIDIDCDVGTIEGGENNPTCKIILDKAGITAPILKRGGYYIALIVHHNAVATNINA